MKEVFSIDLEKIPAIEREKKWHDRLLGSMTPFQKKLYAYEENLGILIDEKHAEYDDLERSFDEDEDEDSENMSTSNEVLSEKLERIDKEILRLNFIVNLVHDFLEAEIRIKYRIYESEIYFLFTKNYEIIIPGKPPIDESLN